MRLLVEHDMGIVECLPPVRGQAVSPDESTLIVATYRRVSTHEQLNGFGLEDQDRINRTWLELHPGAIVHGDYVDEAVSGAAESRPGMDRLIADARRGSFNRILVPKVDRVGRTARAAYHWAWKMADLGVHFISAAESIDTGTEAGWAMFRQQVRGAEIEWRRIRERTFVGREMKISYGGWPGGVPPYGYTLASDICVAAGRRKKLSVLVTDPDEASVLLTAADLIIDEGLNLTQLAAELNRRGLSTRSGVPWTVGNIRNRLWSETIHDGHVVYRKTSRGTAGNTTTRHEDGTPAFGASLKIGIPPIFSPERASQLGEALRRVGFRNGRRKSHAYPLSGRIVGRCGEVYVGGVQSSTGGDRAYRCKGVLKKKPCGEPSFKADEIEEAVWSELAKITAHELRTGVLEPQAAIGSKADSAGYAIRVLDFEQRIEAQQRLLDQKVPEYVAAGVDPELMAAAARALQSELHELRAQYAMARQWLDELSGHGRAVGNLTELVARLGEPWANLTVAEYAEILAELDVRVAPGPMRHVRKSGVRCFVSEWHWQTGVLVPADPDEEEWAQVLEIVRRYFPKRHFTSAYDLRKLFCGSLHRLRHGLAWADMPDAFGPCGVVRERQLKWFKRGAWQEVVTHLNSAGLPGAPAFRRPTLPQLTVSHRLGNSSSSSLHPEA